MWGGADTDPAVAVEVMRLCVEMRDRLAQTSRVFASYAPSGPTVAVLLFFFLLLLLVVVVVCNCVCLPVCLPVCLYLSLCLCVCVWQGP
jgi:hypothetical protein